MNVLGKSTPVINPGNDSVITQILVSSHAIWTGIIPLSERDDYTIPSFKALNIFPYFFNNPGTFMSQHMWKIVANKWDIPPPHMPVASADPIRLNFDDDPVWSKCRICHFFDIHGFSYFF